MPKSRACQVVAACGAITAAALLSGCGDTGREPGHTPDLSPDTGAAVRTSASPGRVVFQMTGSLLIMPARQNGGRTYVLLPKAQKHLAWLGIGRPDDPAVAQSLCERTNPHANDAYLAEICYVNLATWRLLPFGAGGQPTAASTLSDSVLNVTASSGGKHKVHFPDARGKLRSMLVLLSGKPHGTCSMAEWEVDLVNPDGSVQTTQRKVLANLVNWEIADPALELVFELQRDRDSVLVVPLNSASGSGAEVRMLLAHIPEGEEKYLPPGRGNETFDPAKKAEHFHASYDVLIDPASTPPEIPQGAARRNIPRAPKNLENPCPVRITTLGGARIAAGSRNIGTYACNPGTAEGS